jgi:hypothetical protein
MAGRLVTNIGRRWWQVGRDSTLFSCALSLSQNALHFVAPLLTSCEPLPPTHSGNMLATFIFSGFSFWLMTGTLCWRRLVASASAIGPRRKSRTTQRTIRLNLRANRVRCMHQLPSPLIFRWQFSGSRIRY